MALGQPAHQKMPSWVGSRQGGVSISAQIGHIPPYPRFFWLALASCILKSTLAPLTLSPPSPAHFSSNWPSRLHCICPIGDPGDFRSIISHSPITYSSFCGSRSARQRRFCRENHALPHKSAHPPQDYQERRGSILLKISTCLFVCHSQLH